MIAGFDGSWQKCGYTSLNGIISATSFDTGKILDIEVKSKFCFVCHTNPTSEHKCKKNYEQVVEWKVLVYSTFSIVQFVPEIFVIQSIFVMGTAKHTKGWLQRSPMVQIYP
jgi:hypothetical protein